MERKRKKKKKSEAAKERSRKDFFFFLKGGEKVQFQVDEKTLRTLNKHRHTIT